MRIVNHQWNDVIVGLVYNLVSKGKFPLQVIPEYEQLSFIQKNANISYLKLSKLNFLKTSLNTLKLNSLYLKNCPKLNDDHLKAAFAIKTLSILLITGHETHQITYKAFHNISNSALKTLSIRNCHWLTSPILLKIAKLKNLSILDVGSSNGLFIEELTFPEKKFNKLSCLTISSGMIDDNNFANLFSPNLTALDLSTNQISDDAFPKIQNKPTHQLSILKLNFCKITDSGLHLIPQLFPNLSMLCLNHCDQITDLGIRQIKEQYSSVKICYA